MYICFFAQDVCVHWQMVLKKATDRRNSLCILPVLAVLLSPWLQADPGSNAENANKRTQWISPSAVLLFSYSGSAKYNLGLKPPYIQTESGNSFFFHDRDINLHSYHNMVLVVLQRRELLFWVKKKIMDAFLLALSYLFFLSGLEQRR